MKTELIILTKKGIKSIPFFLIKPEINEEELDLNIQEQIIKGKI